MENDNNKLHYMQISLDHMAMMNYLSDEQRGILFRLVFEYFRGEKTENDIIAEINRENNIILPIFSLLKTSIDRGRNAYEERCRQNRENGKKGGAPKGNQNARKRKKSNIENDELEEDYEEEYSNTTLAHWYNCLEDELNEAKTSFSAFFNFEQLCSFFAMLSVIVVLFEPQPTQSSDMSFEAYLQGGANTFIHKCNKLGAEAFLNEMKNEYKESAVNGALAHNVDYTKEKLEKDFDILIMPTPGLEMILSSVAREYN